MEPVATPPVATPSWEPYQVFINHRGEDTKKNIASLIYHALKPYGLRVFLDQYVLCQGDTIETEIRGAISSSSIHIAIFSKNYAESRWCLKELCWMLTSSHEPWFIPIFCDVEPWELSFVEKGCYAKAFEKHRKRESTEVVDEWKEALGKAASISVKVFKGKEALGKAAGNSDTVFYRKESDDYGKLLRNIENTVMEHVKRLWMPPLAVGLDQAWKDLHDQIKKQSSKKVVVIAGLGGIGKSTLARHIFNKLSRWEFRRASFLFNVRETDDHDLQRQLCRDLLGKNMLDGWREGKTMLRMSLKGLEVLIVFDDVDDWHKIERVLDVRAVEEGSLIFVTSRDKGVVRASYAFVYDVEPLKDKHARELFCYHASLQSNSLEGCADLVEDFLKICGGSPLWLQVLGEQLSSNSDRTHWERQLKLYSQGASLPGADDVINKLKWSCKDIEERRMLLDVAYFLVGEDVELAVQVLEGLDYMKGVHYSLRRLCETYYISFKNDVDYHHDKASAYAAREASATLTKRSTKIIMRNEVREMARRIVREDQCEPLRLRCAVDFEKQMRWPKHSESMMAVKEFEKLLNSFHGVTLREVPSTATYESPLVLAKVHSYSAILMCFIMRYRPFSPIWDGNFVVRFEACNGGARSEEFLSRDILREIRRNRARVHVYMWTQRSTLFRDEDNFYDNVSIYKRGRFNVEGGDRGWILTFSSENHVLDVLNQIINPSAEVEYGLDLLFGEQGRSEIFLVCKFRATIINCCGYAYCPRHILRKNY